MAYALRKQYGENDILDLQKASSDAQSAKPRLTLLEGGLSKAKPEPAKIQAPNAVSHRFRMPAPKPEAATLPRRSGLPVALVAAAVAFAICIFSIFATQIAEAKLAQELIDVPATEYAVASGDSLWAIASAHPIEGHATSYVVKWIAARNGLDSGLIVPGQALMVPARNG